MKSCRLFPHFTVKNQTHINSSRFSALSNALKALCGEAAEVNFKNEENGNLNALSTQARTLDANKKSSTQSQSAYADFIKAHEAKKREAFKKP